MPVWDAVQGAANWFVRGFEDFWGIPHYEKGKVDAGEHFAKTMGAGLTTAFSIGVAGSAIYSGSKHLAAGKHGSGLLKSGGQSKGILDRTTIDYVKDWREGSSTYGQWLESGRHVTDQAISSSWTGWREAAIRGGAGFGGQLGAYGLMRALYPVEWLGVGAYTSAQSLNYVSAWSQLGDISSARALGYLAAQSEMYAGLEATRHANIMAQSAGYAARDYQTRMYYNQSQGGYYYPRADSFGNAGLGW